MSRAVRFVIPGRPVPAARPMVTKKGVFYPKRYQDWLKAAKVYARQAWLGKEPLTGPVVVDIELYGSRRNADLDNLVKGVLDALQGTVVSDDKQVEALQVWRAKTKGYPRTNVTVVCGSRVGAGHG